MRELSIRIDPAGDGRTVLSLLRQELACSDAHIARLKRRETGIRLNGTRCYVTARVRAGDELTVEIGDEPDGHIVPMAYPLEIRYEDEDLLVLNKPAGIAVHQSTRDPEELTLENAVCHYLGGTICPHPVSRLDRGTSGLMAFAKSGYIHERLRRQMHSEGYQRVYLGIACGRVDPPGGSITLPIGMAEGSTYRRAICPNGQSARTDYETLFFRNRFTLLRLVPQTGRTHQLRLHMAAIGFPLAGDWLYGAEDRALIARPALHSYELILTHPISGERIRLTAGLPQDMRSLMDGSNAAVREKESK
ncbi:MAG: RluA family pseudouridine synthase [Eubacteriales bacterium]|nr:RluA family pseudouridine synthase [Eubacteriales bacterium]